MMGSGYPESSLDKKKVAKMEEALPGQKAAVPLGAAAAVVIQPVKPEALRVVCGLGMGGFATVVRVRDELTGAHYALKVQILPSTPPCPPSSNPHQRPLLSVRKKNKKGPSWPYATTSRVLFIPP